MRKWLYLTVLVLALLVLALAGWTVRGVRTVARPLLPGRRDRREEIS